jgi:hypothetical protein
MSQAAKLTQEMATLTAQIDAIESGVKIGLSRNNGYLQEFHPKAYEMCKEHVLAVLKATRADLMVEMAREVGLPARLEAIEECVVVQRPNPPQPPALPSSE